MGEPDFIRYEHLEFMDNNLGDIRGWSAERLFPYVSCEFPELSQEQVHTLIDYWKTQTGPQKDSEL